MSTSGCPQGCVGGDVVYLEAVRPLWSLGKVYWYRCQDCGCEFCSPVELAADSIEEETDGEQDHS